MESVKAERRKKEKPIHDDFIGSSLWATRAQSYLEGYEASVECISDLAACRVEEEVLIYQCLLPLIKYCPLGVNFPILSGLHVYQNGRAGSCRQMWHRNQEQKVSTALCIQRHGSARFHLLVAGCYSNG